MPASIDLSVPAPSLPVFDHVQGVGGGGAESNRGEG